MSYEGSTLSSWFFQVDPSCSHKVWLFDEAFSCSSVQIQLLVASENTWLSGKCCIVFSSYIHNLCSSSVKNSWLERLPETSPSTCLIGFLRHAGFTLQLNSTAFVILFFPLFIFHCSHHSAFLDLLFSYRVISLSSSPRCRHIFLVSSCFDHCVIIWSWLCWLYHHHHHHRPVTAHCSDSAAKVEAAGCCRRPDCLL